MQLFWFNGRAPKIDPTAFVAPTGSPAVVKGPIEGTGAELWINANPPYYRIWRSATAKVWRRSN
ncbi:hypothetical protein MHIB_30570 [Mycolicibacter hiberniae]|uniref:Uncharacterized protein n=1 Tax=Mycolicibacter hiberniae TaxID=29314 RepID=A0A7I7X493_9MYCO|nr:hypothetical protein [Mycolicibacter hiberniae]ORV68201.1 hypothetical protein AWC09_15430 [Mycolicibacter hiberniae]BBZ24639.1 hypothetical protein MHIB_30570 [Mycolicibacter hiberniae]